MISIFCLCHCSCSRLWREKWKECIRGGESHWISNRFCSFVFIFVFSSSTPFFISSCQSSGKQHAYIKKNKLVICFKAPLFLLLLLSPLRRSHKETSRSPVESCLLYFYWCRIKFINLLGVI